ncbi:MAG TPA: TylF/MycF family methyltransferase [Nitrospiraceae bacterium]|jgi:hypothetical protein
MTLANDTARSFYLDLLKRALTNWIHGHEEWVAVEPSGIRGKLFRALCPDGCTLVTPKRFDPEKRSAGQDWPPPVIAHTMIGIKRLDNLQSCIEQVIADDISGDLIETGVWKGGSTIFMRGVLKAYGVQDRRVWVADSFEGLPAPDLRQFPEDAGDTHYTFDSLRVPMERVKENFDAYGLLDSQVCFLKGWFKDTLPRAPIDRLSILRLDGDMYESTMVALQSLYPKLSIGGFLIVDDYCIPTCAKAIHDYRYANQIAEEIVPIDGTGVYWRRRV